MDFLLFLFCSEERVGDRILDWMVFRFRYWTFCNEDVLVKRERERIRVLESCGLFWNVLLRYWIFVTKYEQRIED